MKKLILALLATGAFVSANAQAGSILLYGNAGYSSVNDTAKAQNNTRNWNVNPGIGYQINSCLTVGLNFGFGEQTYKTNLPGTAGDRTVMNHYNVGIFARCSHAIMGSKIFSAYGQLDLSYMGGYTTRGSVPSYDKYTGFGGDLYPAIGVNCGHGVALNFGIGGLGYSSTTYTGHSTAATSFNVTFGQQANIGVSKNFGGHKMHGHHEPGDDTRRMDDGDNDDNGGSSKGHKHHKKDKDGDDE